MKNSETANRSRPARGALKERQRAERAELILDAAEEVFAEKGYHDAAIEEIAARVGISKGAIYLHFASKEALLEAWFARQIARFLAMVDDATAEATTVRERLERILDWCYRRMSGEDRAVLLELGSIGLANSVINQRPALLASAARATERITALLGCQCADAHPGRRVRRTADGRLRAAAGKRPVPAHGTRRLRQPQLLRAPGDPVGIGRLTPERRSARPPH